MPEIDEGLPPTQQPSVFDHREKAPILSSIDDKAFPPYEHQYQGGDVQSVQETEESSELYDTNVYEGTFRLNLTPY